MQYDDQRAFARSQTVCGLTYRPAGGGLCTEGACINISGSGILFIGGIALETGRAAEVRLISENKITPALTVYIEIARCEPTPGGGYEIAGTIKGIKSV